MFKLIDVFKSTKIHKQLRLLPYSLVGILVFSLNTNVDSSPYLQIYIMILEAQLGIASVYLLSKKLGKLNRDR
jgi:hypothetical protein